MRQHNAVYELSKSQRIQIDVADPRTARVDGGGRKPQQAASMFPAGFVEKCELLILLLYRILVLDSNQDERKKN